MLRARRAVLGMLFAVCCGTALATAPPATAEEVEWAGSGPLEHVYDPTTPETPPQYLNDHTVIKGRDGLWHMFSIVGDKTPPGVFPPADQEDNFAHATARDLRGPWTTQPYALTVDPGYHGEDHLWAPHVIEHDGVYYMFYSGGGADPNAWAMSVATSTDLFHWERLPSGPLFRDYVGARDPNVVRVGDQWVMYYTANSATENGDHIVAYRTSRDLTHWSERKTAFTDATHAGISASLTESPFVVRRGDWWYLFIGPRGGYVGTDVYRSKDPLHFELADYAGHVPAHAAEVVRSGDEWWVTGAGSFQRGLYLAPLHWDARPPTWQSARNPAVATNADGRLEVFALSESGSLLRRAQREPGGAWDGWSDLGGNLGAVPTVASEQDGRLVLFSLDPDTGNVLTRRQSSPGGAWGEWSGLGGPVAAAPSVTRDSGGRLHAFALAADASTLLHNEQTRPGGAWTGWSDIGGPSGAPPVAVSNSDGRLEVFSVADADSSLGHRWQLTPGGEWSEWEAFGGPAATKTPTVTRNADGRMAVFAMHPMGLGMSHRAQAEPSHGWLDWQQVAGNSEAPPGLAAHADGRLAAFLPLPDNVTVRALEQDQPGGGWADTGELSGRVGCTPVAGTQADGRLSAFAVAEDGDGLRVRTQTAPDGAWGEWEDFGGGRLGGLPCGTAR